MNPAQPRASTPPGDAAQNLVAKGSTTNAPGSISTPDAFSRNRPGAFPVTYFRLAEPLTCKPKGSNVTPGSGASEKVLVQHVSSTDETPAEEDREAEPEVAATKPKATG